MSTILPLSVIIVIAAGLILTVYILSTEYHTESLSLPRRSIDYIPLTHIDFKLPTYIPPDYCPYDSWGDNDIFGIVFAPCNLDDPPSQTWIQFTATRHPEASAEYYKNYKANSQRGDKIQLFDINGNPAMGWEAGKKNSIIMYENGTIISKEEIDYPAYIGMVDLNDNKGYGITAYLPLDELKKIMESLEYP